MKDCEYEEYWKLMRKEAGYYLSEREKDKVHDLEHQFLKQLMREECIKNLEQKKFNTEFEAKDVTTAKELINFLSRFNRLGDVGVIYSDFFHSKIGDYTELIKKHFNLD